MGCDEESPETSDTFLADFAVAVGAGQVNHMQLANTHLLCIQFNLTVGEGSTFYFYFYPVSLFPFLVLEASPRYNI